VKVPPILFSSRAERLFIMLVIFADLDRINDAAPTAFEVKDRHIQHEHRIMLTPPLLKVVPQLISYFVLFNVVVVHSVSFFVFVSSREHEQSEQAQNDPDERT